MGIVGFIGNSAAAPCLLLVLILVFVLIVGLLILVTAASTIGNWLSRAVAQAQKLADGLA
jgi:hypothetical protein